MAWVDAKNIEKGKVSLHYVFTPLHATGAGRNDPHGHPCHFPCHPGHLWQPKWRPFSKGLKMIMSLFLSKSWESVTEVCAPNYVIIPCHHLTLKTPVTAKYSWLDYPQHAMLGAEGPVINNGEGEGRGGAVKWEGDKSSFTHTKRKWRGGGGGTETVLAMLKRGA